MPPLSRDLRAGDKPGWRVLWQGYLDFYGQEIAPSVTETLWARLHDPAEPIHGVVVIDGNDLLGFVHCVFHRNTWGIADVCYLEDLFVHPDARGRGAGRLLIEAVYTKAKDVGANRVYWITDETNTRARSLYDKLATPMGFVQYRKYL